MSKDEVARCLGVSVGVVERYTARGRLTVKDSSAGGHLSYDEEEMHLRLIDRVYGLRAWRADKPRRAAAELEQRVQMRTSQAQSRAAEVRVKR